MQGGEITKVDVNAIKEQLKATNVPEEHAEKMLDIFDKCTKIGSQ